MAYAGAVFLISATTYIVMKTAGHYVRRAERHEILIQECILRVKDFSWCYWSVTLD